MTTLSARGPVHAPRVIAVSAMAILVAFLMQTSVLPAVGLSAAVPVVFAVIVLLGVVLGGRTAAVCGFLAGLLLDVTGVGVLGVGALVGTLVGAAAGRIRVDRWWLSGVPAAAALTIAAALAYPGLNAALTGLPLALSWSLIWPVGGGLVCAALLLPLRGWLREVVR